MYWKKMAVIGAALAIGAAPAWADEVPVAEDQPTAQLESQSSSETTQDTAPVATSATPAQVQTRFEARFPGVAVDEVRITPFDNLYEIRVGRDLLYADADVNFLLQGALIDAQNRKDLSAQRLEELSRVAFADLPLKLAIKQTYGKGTHKIAVFEDPNCGYCQRFHQTLQETGDPTVYTFL